VLLSPAWSQSDPNKFCREDMSVCSCPKEETACYFKFAVQRLITFTRYLNGYPTGYGGKSFFINDMGELQHVSTGGPDPYGCSDTNCSLSANTVDGKTYRTFIGINGRIPGPMLVVYQNQTVVVEVVNMMLTEVTTIHWHGLSQFNTPWMDGAGTVSQCPIEPGTSFTYIFNVSCAGTFWYHSHSGAQRSEGLFGALVVKSDFEAKEYPIPFIDNPENYTLTLLDWQREESTTLFWKELSKLRFFPDADTCPNEVPTAKRDSMSVTRGVDQSGIGTFRWWSGLINGLGKHEDVPFNNSILSVFTIKTGSTYRFRLIGVQSVYAYRFSIDSHKLTVIATDSFLIQPVVTDYIIIHSGERYDFVVTANQSGENFWMRAETLEANLTTEDQPAPYPSFPNHLALAVLHYEGTPVPVGPDYLTIPNNTKNCSEENLCTAVNCPFENYNPAYYINCINVDKLKLFKETPLDELPSSKYDEQYFLNFGFENQFRTGTINARNFIPYKVSPSIQPDMIPATTLCNQQDDCLDGCLCTHQLDLKFNQTVRFVFSSAGLSPDRRRFTHPVHFHGHDFHVVGIGYGTYNSTTGAIMTPTKDIVCDPMKSNNATCVSPNWTNATGPDITLDRTTIRKDTVLVPALGYVIVHFKTNNPGWWFLHCHMEPHQLEGMAMVINEAPDLQPPPPKGMQTCGNFTWTVEEFTLGTRFENSSDSGLPTGAIVGISVGAFAIAVVIIILVILIILCCCVKKKSYDPTAHPGIEMKSTKTVT
jgi:FtsP/CotA-like multicopper oxidase with cupredoxin domain